MTGNPNEHGCKTDSHASADTWCPDKVVMISDWLKRIGGGVNTVMKDQIDYLSHEHGIPVDILMEGGDYEPEAPATFATFPDSGDSNSICEVLRRHIVEPAAQGFRIAVTADLSAPGPIFRKPRFPRL